MLEQYGVGSHIPELIAPPIDVPNDLANNITPISPKLSQPDVFRSKAQVESLIFDILIKYRSPDKYGPIKDYINTLPKEVRPEVEGLIENINTDKTGELYPEILEAQRQRASFYNDLINKEPKIDPISDSLTASDIRPERSTDYKPTIASTDHDIISKSTIKNDDNLDNRIHEAYAETEHNVQHAREVIGQRIDTCMQVVSGAFKELELKLEKVANNNSLGFGDNVDQVKWEVLREALQKHNTFSFKGSIEILLATTLWILSKLPNHVPGAGINLRIGLTDEEISQRINDRTNELRHALRDIGVHKEPRPGLRMSKEAQHYIDKAHRVGAIKTTEAHFARQLADKLGTSN